MKRLNTWFLAVVLLSLAFGAGAALAEEGCAAVATTSGGTEVLAASANKGNGLLCQNLGPTNQVTCSIGGTPVSASHGFILAAAGGNLTLGVSAVTQSSGSGQSRLPSGAVKCISAASTSATCCTSW